MSDPRKAFEFVLGNPVQHMLAAYTTLFPEAPSIYVQYVKKLQTFANEDTPIFAPREMEIFGACEDQLNGNVFTWDNCGQALMCGIAYLGGDYVVVFPWDYDFFTQSFLLVEAIARIRAGETDGGKYLKNNFIYKETREKLGKYQNILLDVEQKGFMDTLEEPIQFVALGYLEDSEILEEELEENESDLFDDDGCATP